MIKCIVIKAYKIICYDRIGKCDRNEKIKKSQEHAYDTHFFYSTH